MKIQSLTKDQELSLARYKQMGIDIGLATGANYDKQLVEDLIRKHRTLCGLPAGEIFHLPSPLSAIKDKRFKGLNTSNAFYGQHEAGWLMFYLFMRIELGLTKETEKLVYIIELIKHVGWVWFGDTQTVVTARPVRLSLVQKSNGIKVLHDTEKFAVEYADGSGVYCLNGITIPAKSEWFFKKEKRTAKKILNEPNTEIRAEFIKAMGPEFFSVYLKKTILDKDSTKTGGKYELYEVDIEGSRRVYLTGVCPSKGDRWHEAVPPTVKTVKEANSWRYFGEIGVNMEPSVAT